MNNITKISQKVAPPARSYTFGSGAESCHEHSWNRLCGIQLYNNRRTWSDQY